MRSVAQCVNVVNFSTKGNVSQCNTCNSGSSMSSGMTKNFDVFCNANFLKLWCDYTSQTKESTWPVVPDRGAPTTPYFDSSESRSLVTDLREKVGCRLEVIENGRYCFPQNCRANRLVEQGVDAIERICLLDECRECIVRLPID